ncbi:MAG: tellurite resistance protein TerC [Saprospiraceae bacterium]|jgi:tellurite resistance protein TerC
MIIWVLFVFVVLLMIIVDLGVFNREAHVISFKEASIWTSIWVSVALLFSIAVHQIYMRGLVDNPSGLTPSEAVVNYLTGYLIELSLSVDNIFVIAVIFATFKIPMKYQHRVLFWGIVGAIVFRALMILFGIVLINQFSWMIYVFGVFLLFTAYKMYTTTEEESFNPRESFVFRQIRKIIPITQEMEGERFFVRRKHIRAATPLFVALIVIEVTDVLFALDSIPAILAITNDPFLVFSSNILAILGLRSMYFFLSNMLDRFSFLEYSLIAILSFVGIKMLLTHLWHIPQWFSLLFILFALVAGVVGSLMQKKVEA